jgi:predicted phosphoribosyltransferase
MGHEEFAIGAIASGGVRVINEDAVRSFGISNAEIEAVTAEERLELERRERRYRGNRPPPMVTGKTIILVDDGLATGSTMRAAVAALRQERPARIIVAVPTAAPETCAELGEEVDDIVCAITPEPFYAVGLWYEDFGQISDEEVHDLLELAARTPHGGHR